MRFYRLTLLALLMTVGLAAPAHADPVITPLVIWATSAAFAASTIGAVVIAGIEIAVSIGLSYAAQAIMGKPDQTEQVGSPGKIQTGGILPRTFMVGYGFTAGKLAYVNTWGKVDKTPNAYLTMVISLSDLPVDSLQGIIVNGSPATYGSGSPDANMGYAIPEFAKDGKDHLWVKFYDGTQAAADTYLTSKFSADPSFPYSSDRIGTGVAYAIVTALVEPTLFSGFPTFKWILNGTPLYDPRLDSTAGGSGSQRFDDPTTWAFTQNPKVIEYNVLRGIKYNDVWFYGLQNLNASRLPTSSWFAAMNECDLDVDNNEGGTEPQFRCGGEIAVSTQPASLIDELDKSCNGRLAEIGGIYKTHVGAAGTPTFSFTDGDLLSTEQQTFDQFPSLSDLINAMTGSFPDPTQGWEMSPAPGRFSSDLELADGGRELISDNQYNLVPYAEQVQRLMQSGLLEARQFRRHTIPLPPGFWFAEPLDFASWTSIRNGYDNKTFRIDLGTDTASLDMVLVITETDPSDYDWNPDTDFIPTVSGPLVIQRPGAQAMFGWNAEGATVDGDDGRQKPAVLFTFTASDITDVDGIIYEIRLAVGGATVSQGESPHSVEQFLLGEYIAGKDLSAGTAYEARGKYRPMSARETSWSDWISLTTPDIRIGAIDLYNEAIKRAALDKALKGFNDFVGSSARDLLDMIQQVSQGVAEAGFGASSDMQTIRRSLKSATDGMTATFDELIYAATGPDSALAGEIATLSTELDGKANNSVTDAISSRVTVTEDDIDLLNTQYTALSSDLAGKASSSAVSALSDEIDAQGDDITANTNAIIDVNTVVGRFSASGIFRVQAVTTQSGADATLAMGVSASDVGGTYTAGIYFNARTSDHKTQVLLVGDQTGIVDSSGTIQALFTSDGAFLNNAVIKDLDAGTITTGTLDVDHIVGADLIKILTYTQSTTTIGTTTTNMFQTADLSAYAGWRIVLLLTGSGTKGSGKNPDINVNVIRDQGGGSSSLLASWSETNGNTLKVSANGQATDTIINGHAVYTATMVSTDTNITGFSGILTVILFKD